MRTIKSRERLAVAVDFLHLGPTAMWWDDGPKVVPTCRFGDIAVVYIRGTLEHHNVGYGDSYEQILERVTCAVDGGEDGKPSAVVLCFDSPGGVVSGLNETVEALKALAEDSGVQFVAYVDGLMASAAYALSTSCELVFIPPSGICGSIGVISTMYEQTKADRKMGLRFVTLSSGARKADGHPHVPISADAEREEQRRVDRLAQQFFGMVSAARSLTVGEVADLEAGIFLGKDAKNVGLADGVATFPAMMYSLGYEKTLAHYSPMGRTYGAQGDAGLEITETKMVALKALVRRTKAALAASKDKKEKAALAAALASYESSLEAYKRVKKTVKYEAESDEGDEDSEEEEAAEESEKEEESEEAESKGNETDRKMDDDSDDDDDNGDDDDGDDEEDEEEAAAKPMKGEKAVLALAQQVTGRRGRAAVGALAAVIAEGQRAKAAVDKIQRERIAEKKTTMIDASLAARRITRPEAKTLRGKQMSFVKSFLAMRPKAMIVTDEDSLLIPSADPKTGDALPADVERSINEAMQVAGEGKSQEQRASIRATMVEAHRKRMNGAAEARY